MEEGREEAEEGDACAERALSVPGPRQHLGFLFLPPFSQRKQLSLSWHKSKERAINRDPENRNV